MVKKGDVISYRTIAGRVRKVKVTKGGANVFDAVLLEPEGWDPAGTPVWGYTKDILF